MSSIVSVIRTRKNAVFEIFVSLSQIFGFSMVILSGYVFNSVGTGIKWPNPNDPNTLSIKNFHGFFMTIGLVFFQGEALLSYRLYRHEAKVLSKFIHVVFHLLAMAFFSTALAVVIMQKNWHNPPQQHFASVHSWIGIAVMAVYVIQFFFGAINFLIPGVSLKVKQSFMPIHRAVGCVSFLACSIQAIIGHTEYIILGAGGATFNGCYWVLNCKTHLDLIYNFSMISLILYAITVLVVVVPTPWRRQKTMDEMK